MSNAKDPDYATGADLAGLSSGEQDLQLKTLPGKTVKIKKVTIGEIADIMKAAKESELDQAMWMVYRGMVNPRCTLQEIKAWPPNVLIEIAMAISSFSGLDKKSMEKTQNLLEIES